MLDAFEGFVDDELGEPQSSWHRRGLKVWFGTTDGSAAREHYEAQLIRSNGDYALEIGFHAEYRTEPENQAALDRLGGKPSWRRALGQDAEAERHGTEPVGVFHEPPRRALDKTLRCGRLRMNRGLGHGGPSSSRDQPAAFRTTTA